jgi:hypothetical protein
MSDREQEAGLDEVLEEETSLNEDSEGRAAPDAGLEEETSRAQMLFHGKVRELGPDLQ